MDVRVVTTRPCASAQRNMVHATDWLPDAGKVTLTTGRFPKKGLGTNSLPIPRARTIKWARGARILRPLGSMICQEATPNVDHFYPSRIPTPY